MENNNSSTKNLLDVLSQNLSKIAGISSNIAVIKGTYDMFFGGNKKGTAENQLPFPVGPTPPNRVSPQRVAGSQIPVTRAMSSINVANAEKMRAKYDPFDMSKMSILKNQKDYTLISNKSNEAYGLVDMFTISTGKTMFGKYVTRIPDIVKTEKGKRYHGIQYMTILLEHLLDMAVKMEPEPDSIMNTMYRMSDDKFWVKAANNPLFKPILFMSDTIQTLTSVFRTTFNVMKSPLLALRFNKVVSKWAYSHELQLHDDMSSQAKTTHILEGVYSAIRAQTELFKAASGKYKENDFLPFKKTQYKLSLFGKGFFGKDVDAYDEEGKYREDTKGSAPLGVLGTLVGAGRTSSLLAGVTGLALPGPNAVVGLYAAYRALKAAKNSKMFKSFVNDIKKKYGFEFEDEEDIKETGFDKSISYTTKLLSYIGDKVKGKGNEEKGSSFLDRIKEHLFRGKSTQEFWSNAQKFQDGDFGGITSGEMRTSYPSLLEYIREAEIVKDDESEVSGASKGYQRAILASLDKLTPVGNNKLSLLYKTATSNIMEAKGIKESERLSNVIAASTPFLSLSRTVDAVVDKDEEKKGTGGLLDMLTSTLSGIGGPIATGIAKFLPMIALIGKGLLLGGAAYVGFQLGKKIGDWVFPVIDEVVNKIKEYVGKKIEEASMWLENKFGTDSNIFNVYRGILGELGIDVKTKHDRWMDDKGNMITSEVTRHSFGDVTKDGAKKLIDQGDMLGRVRATEGFSPESIKSDIFSPKKLGITDYLSPLHTMGIEVTRRKRMRDVITQHVSSMETQAKTIMDMDGLSPAEKHWNLYSYFEAVRRNYEERNPEFANYIIPASDGISVKTEYGTYNFNGNESFSGFLRWRATQDAIEGKRLKEMETGKPFYMSDYQDMLKGNKSGSSDMMSMISDFTKEQFDKLPEKTKDFIIHNTDRLRRMGHDVSLKFKNGVEMSKSFYERSLDKVKQNETLIRGREYILDEYKSEENRKVLKETAESISSGFSSMTSTLSNVINNNTVVQGTKEEVGSILEQMGKDSRRLVDGILNNDSNIIYEQ